MTLPNPTYQELLAERKQRLEYDKKNQKFDRKTNQISSTIWSFIGFLCMFVIFSIFALFSILGINTYITYEHMVESQIKTASSLFNAAYWLIVVYMLWHFISNVCHIWEKELDVMIKGARKALKDNDL